MMELVQSSTDIHAGCDREEGSDDELIDVGEQQQQADEKQKSVDRQHKLPDSMGVLEKEEERLLLQDEGIMQEQDKSMDKSQGGQKVQPEGESEGDFGPFVEYQEDEAMMTELEEELRRAEAMMQAVMSPMELQLIPQSAGSKDQATESPEAAGSDLDKDDFSMLNDILNAPSTGEDDFTQEWQAVFGAPMTITPNTFPAERDMSRRQAEFMPSMLLDTQSSSSFTQSQGGGRSGVGVTEGGVVPVSSSWQAPPSIPPASAAPSAVTTPTAPATAASVKEQKKDMSAWFNLFADLDPLSNPDAIGRESKNVMENL